MSLFFNMIKAGAGVIFGIYKAFDNTAATSTSNENDGFNISGQIICDAQGRIKTRQDNYGTLTTTTRDTYWTVVPQSGVGSAYHFRVTAVVSSSFYSGGEALATWVAGTSDRTWSFTEAQGGPLNMTQDYDVDISDDGGSTTLDTIRITLDYTWDSP